MAIAHELFRGRLQTDSIKKGNKIATFPFLIEEAIDEIDARETAKAAAGLVYDDLILSDVNVTKRIRAGLYYVDAVFKHPDDEEEDLEKGEYRLSFDTSGETERLYWNLDKDGKPTLTQRYINIPFSEVDFKGAVEVRDREPVGVDVFRPALKFEITKKVANGSLSWSYIRSLANLSSKTNDASFFGFAAGELLFRAATGTDSTSGDPEVTYSFLARPNETNIKIGDIPAFDATGHQFIWVYYIEIGDKDEVGEDIDPNNQSIVTVPVAVQANVETVYEEIDFSQLGI